MLTIAGFILVGLAFLNITNNRQLARYLGRSAKSLNSVFVRQTVVLLRMIAFVVGITAIVLSNV
jgi:hypothetical protein